MKTSMVAKIVAVMVLLVSFSPAIARAEEDRPLVQIAILLDTSGSMSGLINQAKTQLWQIVNQFALAKKHGKQPLLQVGLYEYGNDGLPARDSWMRQILPLTDDLDKVSEKLFALTTNGGSEYCGMVIQKAVRGLAWSASNEVYKAIFIAGNEPFTQGPVDYRIACKEAVSKGIVVNTIHCAGASDDGWKDGAIVADGSFSKIDSNQTVVDIAAPQDKALSNLNTELNKTYVAYGAEGATRKALQEAQDTNAAAASGNIASRAYSKAQGYYKNTSWDLVDAVKNDAVKIGDLKEEELPPEMRGMSEDKRVEYVNKVAAQRTEIQARINTLMTERSAYVETETRKRSAEDKSLGSAVMSTVRAQAEKSNFTFE